MEDLSLHILDIIENSTAAGASVIEIRLTRDTRRDRLTLTIGDNGRGMDANLLAGARDPFVTTRTTRRVGLGIPLLAQAARETGGDFRIESSPERGTEITAVFRPGHIDCKPLGDLAGTMVAAILGNPEVDFVYEGDLDGERTSLATREIREQLGDVPITRPEVLNLIRNLLGGATADAERNGGSASQA